MTPLGVIASNSPAVTPRHYALGLWLAAGSLGCILSLYGMAATLIDGAFLPGDHDSFYHAHRILRALSGPWQVRQFDAAIHAPEGSWVTWPWAYDTLMAVLARTALAVTPVRQPLAVFAFVAPLAVFLNAARMLGCARRLGLSFARQVLVIACFATASLTRSLHQVGMLDHHFVEHTFVLATLFTGLGGCAAPTALRPALWLGIVLGLAPAFHNGLFILQLPVLATLVLL